MHAIGTLGRILITEPLVGLALKDTRVSMLWWRNSKGKLEGPYIKLEDARRMMAQRAKETDLQS